MGKKKYFCDFCCRYFNDDKNTRFKHMNSLTHLNLKKEHYNLFRDPEQILKEESEKKPCKKFHYDGFCQFGGSCTYSHYSHQDLNAIRNELAVKKAKMNNEEAGKNIKSWQLNYEQQKESEKQKKAQMIWSSQLPVDYLTDPHSLPPSVLPFHIKEIVEVDLDSWG